MVERDRLLERLEAVAERGLEVDEPLDAAPAAAARTTLAVPSTLVRASSAQSSGSL